MLPWDPAGEDDDEDGQTMGRMFGQGDLDPMALLEDMEAVGLPQANSRRGVQPFQVLRKQRKAASAQGVCLGLQHSCVTAVHTQWHAGHSCPPVSTKLSTPAECT